MTKFGHGLAVLGLVGLGAIAALGQTATLSDSAATPLWPYRIAPIYADGTVGPWQPYVRREPGNLTQELTPIWDTYETCDEYNYIDNTAGERYEPFCLGDCDGRRFLYTAGPCDLNDAEFFVQLSALHSTGGQMAKGGGGKMTDVITYLWGVCFDPINEEPEDYTAVIQLWDSYNGNDCADPGSDGLSGVALGFNPPPRGFYRTTVDLVGQDLSMETPKDGTIGIQLEHYEVFDPQDPENNVFSTRGFQGLWVTKFDWSDEMGIQDDFSFQDFQDPNEELTEDDCTNSGPVCDTDRLGGSFLLLTEGGGSCEPCDTNCDGSVDLTDVASFIDLILEREPQCDPGCSGDTNLDGSVDLTDVEGFIECLLG